MTEAAQTTATEPTGPTIEEIAAQVFGSSPAPEEAPAEAPKEVEPEKPAEAPKAPEVDPKVAARLTAARRAEERAAKSRAEIASQRAEVAPFIEAARVAKESGLEATEIGELIKLAAQVKAARKSPSKAIALMGYEHPKGFLETLATEHEDGALVERAAEQFNPKVAALEAKIEALEKAASERERQAANTTFEAATAAFCAHVDSSPEKYPHLISEYTPAELARAAQEAASSHGAAYRAKFGEWPTDDLIAEYLEDQARARAEALAERRARIGKPAPAVPSKGETPGDQTVSQTVNGSSSPRTLTSRAASEKATAAKSWTQEAADEESIRILKTALSQR